MVVRTGGDSKSYAGLSNVTVEDNSQVPKIVVASKEIDNESSTAGVAKLPGCNILTPDE